MNLLHRSTFIKEVKESFPEIRGRINSERGILNCEMHSFTDFVQEMIFVENHEGVVKAFMIIEKYFANGNSSIVNAICVSFFEHLDLGGINRNASWAYDLLPSTLKAQYVECSKYHNN